MNRINFTALALMTALAGAATGCGNVPEATPLTTVDGGGDGSGDSACVGDCASEAGIDGGFDAGTIERNGSDVMVCATVKATYEPVVPTVVVLVDQSGSMSADYDDGTRWSVLYDALMDGESGVVSTLQSEVNFGLSLYTSQNGSLDGGVCPIMTQVEVGTNNRAAIDAVYASAEPELDTPTGAAISVVASQLADYESDGPRIIVLATDGEPDTCAEPNPQNGQSEAIAAAQEAYGSGIRTVVLGVGDDVSSGHLQDMANAGAGQALDSETPAAFYRPANRAELIADFNDIIDGVRSCLIPLDAEVDEALAEGATITVDGQPITYGVDWRLNGSSHIELLGDTCTEMMDGEHSVNGQFLCASAPSDMIK